MLNILLIYLLVGFVFACIPVIMDGGLDRVGKLAPNLSFPMSVLAYFAIGTVVAPVLILIDSLVVLKSKIKGWL